MDSCKQSQRNRKCLRKQKASKHSNAVKMGVISLIKTPNTIRFTTWKKVVLERIHKHSEQGKSAEVQTAHEAEHRRKCIWLRTKEQRHNGVLFKMITGNGHRITWHGRLRWAVHSMGGAKVTGRSVRPSVWSVFCDTVYSVVQRKAFRTSGCYLMIRCGQRMLYEHIHDYQPLRHYGNFNVRSSLNESLRAERSEDRILVEARFSSTVQTGPPIQGVTGLFPSVKRPGCGLDYPRPSNAAVKEKVELYLYSPSGPSWPVLG
jgi:hypothetical protein